MVLGTVLAFPLAWLVGRTNMYGKEFFLSLFVLTYMVPPYLGAMAWTRLLNPNAGTINVFLRELLNIDARSGPLNICLFYTSRCVSETAPGVHGYPVAPAESQAPPSHRRGTNDGRGHADAGPRRSRLIFFYIISENQKAGCKAL